uniref:KilAC domain protein n=1 Tax=Siphoviridae sp. ct39g3 TaxID=2825320 RepID=A0A8S5P968_9CAUD|nr:MAG TPA: KilAC domain protein [Siphoviridae sp. ct39g3]
MNELLKINYEAEQPTVSARDLHEALEIKSKYADWFKNMSAYGFVENMDYFTFSKNLENGGRTIDHNISVDMAKQICMIQRSEKGKLYRQYFIDLEKAWNTPEQVMARALKLADKTIDTLKEENKKLIEDNERMRPKEIFADAVKASDSSILIGDLAKILRQNGVDTGQKRLFEQLRNEGYLMKTGSSRNMPKQKYVANGFFQIKETVISNPDGSVRMTKTTKVTGKGQQYFLNKYLKNKEAV